MADTKEVRDVTCGYCGKFGNVTRDHVIPGCLWPGDPPEQVPLVDACKDCNNKWKSKHDAYLRDYLINDIACSQNHIAQKLKAKFYRSVVGNHSVLAREMYEHSELRAVVSPSGTITDAVYTLPDAAEQINFIISLIVRGLYQYYIHESLPSNTSFDVYREFDKKHITALIDLMIEQGGFYSCITDGSVFKCLYGQVAEHPLGSVWILDFYGCIKFTVYTNKG